MVPAASRIHAARGLPQCSQTTPTKTFLNGGRGFQPAHKQRRTGRAAILVLPFGNGMRQRRNFLFAGSPSQPEGGFHPPATNGRAGNPALRWARKGRRRRLSHHGRDSAAGGSLDPAAQGPQCLPPAARIHAARGLPHCSQTTPTKTFLNGGRISPASD